MPSYYGFNGEFNGVKEIKTTLVTLMTSHDKNAVTNCTAGRRTAPVRAHAQLAARRITSIVYPASNVTVRCCRPAFASSHFRDCRLSRST